MWLEVVSNLDIFLWQLKERIGGSQLPLGYKGKRNEGENVSVYETSHSSCSFLNSIDLYYYFYHGFKSVVTIYCYYEIKWWISQNLVSSWISLNKASLLCNARVDIHFLIKSQEAFMVISWTCFLAHSKKWTMEKMTRKFWLLVEILLRNPKLRDWTLVHL